MPMMMVPMSSVRKPHMMNVCIRPPYMSRLNCFSFVATIFVASTTRLAMSSVRSNQSSAPRVYRVNRR